MFDMAPCRMTGRIPPRVPYAKIDLVSIPKGKTETFINPAGFIEQHYIGTLKLPAIKKAIEELGKIVEEQKAQKKPALVLIDTSLAATSLFFNTQAHTASIKGMKTIPLGRAAIFGPLVAQVTVNTLAMITGKKDKIRGFTSRQEAIRWLCAGKS